MGAKSDSCTVTVYATATEITLDKTAVDMYVGDEQTIVATVVPQGTKAVTFDSSDKEVATVDTDGTITVVGAGTTTITVTIDGVTANVTVSAVKVAFAQANYSLALNAEQQLALTFEPTTATETNLAYSSSDSAIVSVDGEGKVKAKAYGQATITASVEGKFSVTCTVTVSPLATENGVTVANGGQITLYAEWAKSLDRDDLLYIVRGDEIVLTGYRGKGDVQPFVIPAEIDGKPVVEIGGSLLQVIASIGK